MNENPEPLPLVEQGRMIAALRRDRKNRHSYRYPTYRHSDGTRRWTDEQIRQAFHMTTAEFTQALRAWHATTGVHRTQANTAEQILRYALKQERWPTYKEFGKGARERGLPCASALHRMFPTHTTYGMRPRVQGGLGYQTSFDTFLVYVSQNKSLVKRLTPKLVLAIKNLTIRRKMMEEYGVDLLLKSGGGVLFQEDKYGKLWHLPPDNEHEEFSQYVEVINKTAEPDGSFAHYFLRVKPEIKTAHAAIAESFGVTKKEYKVLAET